MEVEYFTNVGVLFFPARRSYWFPACRMMGRARVARYLYSYSVQSQSRIRAPIRGPRRLSLSPCWGRGPSLSVQVLSADGCGVSEVSHVCTCTSLLAGRTHGSGPSLSFNGCTARSSGLLASTKGQGRYFGPGKSKRGKGRSWEECSSVAVSQSRSQWSCGRASLQAVQGFRGAGRGSLSPCRLPQSHVHPSSPASMAPWELTDWQTRGSPESPESPGSPGTPGSGLGSGSISHGSGNGPMNGELTALCLWGHRLGHGGYIQVGDLNGHLISTVYCVQPHMEVKLVVMGCYIGT